MKTPTEQRHEKWREMVARGMSISDVAKQYGVSRKTVSSAITLETRALNAIVLLMRGRNHGVIRRASGLPLREVRRLAEQDLVSLVSGGEALRAYTETMTLETAGDRQDAARKEPRYDPWPARLRAIPEDAARAYLVGLRRDNLRG